MKDLDTSIYLAEFEEKFLLPIIQADERNKTIPFMRKEEALKADKIRNQRLFLENFTACIKGTLEQNLFLKEKISKELAN